MVRPFVGGGCLGYFKYVIELSRAISTISPKPHLTGTVEILIYSGHCAGAGLKGLGGGGGSLCYRQELSV